MYQQPPQGYQPGGWQQSDNPHQQHNYPAPPPQRPKTQTLNLEYNVASGLCYLPIMFIHFILPIIFISSEPKTNKFVRFHAFQALFMAIGGIVGGIGGYILIVLGFILTALLGAATQSPVAAMLGFIIMILCIVGLVGFGLFMLVSTIIACVKAFSNEVWKVPFFGRLAEKYA